MFEDNEEDRHKDNADGPLIVIKKPVHAAILAPNFGNPRAARPTGRHRDARSRDGRSKQRPYENKLQVAFCFPTETERRPTVGVRRRGKR